MTKISNFNQAVRALPRGIFQGAFIDKEGREVPITEGMIQKACRELETAANSFYPRFNDYNPSLSSPYQAISRRSKTQGL